MPIRKITDTQLGLITTSKLLVITSSESLYVMSTGNRTVEVTNLGPHRVYYGNTGVTANSGGIISPNGSKAWDNVIDNFSLYFVLGSAGVSSNVVVHEYTGL